jgi:hypothetical protein
MGENISDTQSLMYFEKNVILFVVFADSMIKYSQ